MQFIFCVISGTNLQPAVWQAMPRARELPGYPWPFIKLWKVFYTTSFERSRKRPKKVVGKNNSPNIVKHLSRTPVQNSSWTNGPSCRMLIYHTKMMLLLPIPSMYGIIFTYIWLIFMVNVGKYTMHGFYGLLSLNCSGSSPVLLSACVSENFTAPLTWRWNASIYTQKTKLN